MNTMLLLLLFVGLGGYGFLPARQGVDWKAVDAAIGGPGSAQPDDVHRFSFPRTDLRVTADGVPIRPAFALGGWIAMKPVADGVMAMGDLVLTEEELAPVIARLQAGGVEQTAIHHHLIRESPRILYMHVHAHGDAVAIATAVGAAVALTGAPSPVAANPPAVPAPVELDTVALARVLGRGGQISGGVYQLRFPHVGAVHEGSFEIPPSMGLSTAINFQPTGGGRAAITGDFVLTGDEVNPVIRALRDNGIQVVSLHNHLIGEQPRLFFMHFWANDDALKLARGLRAALDRTGSGQGGP